jgi:hypothetical protein
VNPANKREREKHGRKGLWKNQHMGLQLDEEEADKSQEEKWGKKSTIKMTRRNMQMIQN